MFTWAFYLAVGFAFLDWASTWKGWKKRLYVAKPATMLFLIIWTYQVTGWQGDLIWFALALCCSLAGDVALMLNPRYFMIGLGAFLLAHVAYLVGFNQAPVPVSLGVLLVSILVGISAARVFRIIRPGIMKVPRGKRFLSAVMIYGLTLTLMMLSTLITLFRSDWLLLPGILAASGGILFYASDSLLAFDRFVRKINHGQSLVHLTYHLAQFAIISGAVLHFLR
jgi:uncharacterized membrane protein YhhN